MYETCRFCDKEDESVVCDVEPYLEQIQSLTQLEINLDDDYPSKICEDCVSRLTNAIEFRDLCRRSEEMLVVQMQYFQQDNPKVRSSSPESQLLMNLGASMTRETDTDRFGQKDWNDVDYVRNVIRRKDLKLAKPKLPAPIPQVVKPEKVMEEQICDEEPVYELFEENLDDDDETPQNTNVDDFSGYEALPPSAAPTPTPGKLSKHGPWTCESCGLTYQKKASFHTHWYHKHKHAGMKWVCEECGRVYEKAAQLKEHLNVHLPVKPFECDMCGARFSRKYAVVNHMFSHTKKKRYQCQYCPKAYTFYSDIKRHETSHTGVYIYNCQICKKGYNRKKQLLEHEREHILQ